MSLRPDTIENDPFEVPMSSQVELARLERMYGDMLRSIAVNSANGQDCSKSVRELLGTLSQEYGGVTVDVDEGQVIVRL